MTCQVTRRGFDPHPSLSQMLPWPSGNGISLTWRRSQVRVLPGVLHCGVDWSLDSSTVSYAARRRFESGLRNFPGLLVEEEDAAVARRKSGCDSPAVHWFLGPVVQREDASLACWKCGFDSRLVH